MRIRLYFFVCVPFTSLAMEKIWHHTFLDTPSYPQTQPGRNNTFSDMHDTDESSESADSQSTNSQDSDSELQEPFEIPATPLFQPQPLRTMCINTIARLCVTDTRFNATSLACLPHDLASELLARLKGNISGTKLIKSLQPREYVTYKMSPDGAHILVIPANPSKPLLVLDGRSGEQRHLLEESLTSDTQANVDSNNRFIPVGWSTAGRYVYACFNYSKIGQDAQYVYKVWDATTGKLLPYTIPFTPLGKLYFSSDDRWLLGKQMEKPLMVHESASGALRASLGPASASYEKQKCHDPRHEWISVPDGMTTYLYDSESLKLQHTLLGQLKSFSTDGTLLATHEVTPNKPDFVECDRARIYNRRAEIVNIIPLRGQMYYSMAFAPTTPVLYVFDNQTENHYSLETKEPIKILNHLYFKKRGNPFSPEKIIPGCYTDATGQTTISLARTLITLTTPSGSKKIVCNTKVKDLRYTYDPAIVALGDYCKIRFFLHLPTGALVPCNIQLHSSLFSHRPITKLSCHEYFITKKDSSQQLVRLERPAAIEPIIAMLTQKVAK